MRSNLVRLAVAAAMTLMCLTAAPSAGAGTYNVYQCDLATGAGLSPQWAKLLNGSWPATNKCAAGVEVAGMGLDGVYALYSLYLPTGLTFNSVDFWSQGLGSPSVPIYALLCNGDAIPICPWQPGGYTDLNQSSAKHVMNSPGTNVLRIGIGGTPFTHFTSNGYASVWNMSLTLRDDVAPVLGASSGSIKTASGDNWNRGTVSGGVSGTDGQSGIKSLLATIDANPVGVGSVSQNNTCSNLNVVPCPVSSGAWSPAIATNALADGPHALRYSALDYAGNTSQTASSEFKVDNTAPAVPANVQTPGPGGWNSNNDFDIAWTNTGETIETATQSGIAAVKVDVEPTDAGTQSNPPAMTVPVGTPVNGVVATIESISNLSVPAPGAWKLKLATVDRAGNESPVGDGSGGPTDGVFPIGFDPNPPAKPQGQSNGWISRDELASGFVAQWSQPHGGNDAPICGYAHSITAVGSDPGTSITLPGAVTNLVVPGNLAEGPHYLNLRSVNCAGQAATGTENIPIPVDLTDPVGLIEGVRDGEWYGQDVSIELKSADSLSGMAGADASDPDLTHGAYLVYELDRQGQIRTRGGSSSYVASSEDTHVFSFASVDYAGNKAATQVVSFGIDKSNPTGAFSNGDPARPTLLLAPVNDAVSGLAVATIEIRRQGGNDWQSLPTSISDAAGNAIAGYPKDANVSARFPDTSLPKGVYDVRLRAYDRAGNSLITRRRADGSDMTITNPVRAGVTLSAGLSKARRACGKKRGARCLRRFRGQVVFSGTYPALSVGFKRGAVVQGVLTDSKFGRLGGQPIEIYSKLAGRAEERVGETSTRSDGTYVFKLRPGLSRKVRVYYPGTERREDASAVVSLGTAAKVKLQVSKRHAYTGQVVSFSGTVRSFDRVIPAAGKLIVLQFKAGRRWLPAVGVAHTDDKGRFTVRYRFSGKRVKNRIVFRAFAPTEDGWGHAASASPRVSMTLN